MIEMTICLAGFPSIEQWYSDVIISRRMTIAHFNLLTLVLQTRPINDEERCLVERVLYAIQRKRLTLVGISDEQLHLFQSRLRNILLQSQSA